MKDVSIIIPTYNVEEYITQTVESALNQTDNDNTVILVDDGSADNSGMFCDEFAFDNPNVISVHKSNGWLSSARNTGVALSNSEYVLLLDGDDYLSNDALERLKKVSNDYPSDIIQFKYVEVEENEIPEKKEAPTKVLYQSDNPVELFQHMYELGGIGASGCTKLFKRELLRKIQFENVRHEDEMWCAMAYQESLKITYIDDELYYYVMRKSSFIHSKFNAKNLDLFYVLRERTEILKKLSAYELLYYDYNRIFLSAVEFFCKAKIGRDKESCKKIKAIFMREKENMQKYCKLAGRKKFLFLLMCKNFNFIYLRYIEFILKEWRKKYEE